MKNATLKEVARAAGVSTQTVSRVVNQRPDVAEKTRHHVQQIIREMGYHPNSIARSLITRRTHSLGVVTSGLEYYGPSTTLVGIQHAAEELGYSLTLILSHEPDPLDYEQIFSAFGSRQVDGIIWAVPPVAENRATYILPHLMDLPPVLLLNQPNPAFNVVSIDNRQGAMLAVSHLLERGYRHIGMVSGPAGWWEAAERSLGWRQALHDHDLPLDDTWQLDGDWTAASGEHGFHELINRHPDVDAVFAANDQIALGVLKAAHALGIDVPGRLGVAGFDDYPESGFFIPALTTIRQPLHDMGARAVQEVVQLIQLRQAGEEYPSKTIILPTQLIIRESSRRLHS